MSALLDSLAAGFDGDAARRAMLDAALRAGMPGPRSEVWKYTSLRALDRRVFGRVPLAVPQVDDAVLAAIPAPRMVFVNGRFDPVRSDVGDLAEGITLSRISPSADAAPTEVVARAGEVFAAMNAALADDGASITLSANIHLDHPLHLVFVGCPATVDLAWHLRHRIVLADGASATIIEHHVHAGANAHLGSAVTTIDLGAGARLVHARIQDLAPQATAFATTQARLGDDATYQRVDLELGGGLSRHALNVCLDGDRAVLLSSGAIVANGRRHVEARLGVVHAGRDTRCELLWRGIASDRARVVFHGGILIQPGADGSDARLSNKNLLLSDTAEVDTQPVLEIHADEVKAAHGATVGQLDPVALFYLRSRGLPESDARALLTTAFSRDVLAGIQDTRMRTTMSDALDAALERMEGA